MIEEVLIVNGYVKDGKDISTTIRSAYYGARHKGDN